MMMVMIMKRIMIVEDDQVICQELTELLVHADYEVVILEDFQNAKEEILRADVDLLLLDIHIPYMNGEFLLKELRKETDIPVMMVTSCNNEIDEVLSMSYGADDYITKPYNPHILLLRIGAILKRTGQFRDVLTYQGIKINVGRGVLMKDNQELVLTKNEMIIFQSLLNHRGRIVSRDDLMTDLWSNDEYINDNALTVNISRLRAKLCDFGYPDIIETRKGQGYILL